MKIGFIGAGNMGGAILRGYAPFANKDGNEKATDSPAGPRVSAEDMADRKSTRLNSSH